MKPLFGFNRTTNQPSYAHKFIVKTISKGLENEYDEIAKVSFNIHRKLENKLKKYSVYIIIFGIILLGICCGFMFMEGFDKMWETRSWLFILGIIAFVFGCIARIVAIFIKPNKSLFEDLEWNKQELNEWYKKRDNYFNYEDNYYNIDILCPQYREKNNQIKLEVPLNVFNNIPTVMYKKDDYLYISDNLSLYEIPFENFESIEIIHQPRQFMNWTQEEECTKEYQAKCNNEVYKMSASYKTKSYAKVVFTFEEEKYYFEILPYDFEDALKIFPVNKEENSSEKTQVVYDENLFEQVDNDNEK